MAHFVRQEAPRLSRVLSDDATTVLNLLTRERTSIQADAGWIRNQIHALLAQLDPEYDQHLPNLGTKAGMRALATYQASGIGPLQEARAASVHRLAKRLLVAVGQIADLAKQIRTCAAQAGFSPLTRICGVNLLNGGDTGGNPRSRPALRK